MSRPNDNIRPVVLCILDGWGHRAEKEHNAIAVAETPVMNRWLATCPNALIQCSETQVGLPSGQMGNSEVGHMNLGAGRIVLQDLPRIDAAVDTGSLATLPEMKSVLDALKKNGRTAHLLGLMSPGGVHSHQHHIAAVAKVLHRSGVKVAIHAFLDGRDTPPRSALDYLERFQRDAPDARVATICGRYYAMDRDNRWERVEAAYDALVLARGEHAPTAREAVEAGYARDESDEFLKPTTVADFTGMADGDAMLMMNFRADRAREILQSLLLPDFDAFERKGRVRFSAVAGLVEYSRELSAYLPALFPPEDVEDSLGEVVAGAGLAQLRIAETEKYAHVTFFFNGGREAPFDGEERILVPSPNVATYDMKPEMSAPEVTDALVQAIESRRFGLVVVNYANADMVGHTGNLDAAARAIETVDHCLGRLEAAVRQVGGALLVTADHGNAEQMSDATTGQAHTAHTMNPVPLILVNGPDAVGSLASGRLADLAPTVLALLGLPQPSKMTGSVLLRVSPQA